MTFLVPLTALRLGLVAYQVDPDLHSTGLTSLRCATVQRRVNPGRHGLLRQSL
jgi:hypothetical protein